ncbi:MAG TPA: adenylate/guanylate cyclase domain-containing protein [Acidimicrobiia bacterium]|nr:adenylate/guanylate cyclase domain-containing protein [Acidimicrobiia bacterium]
MTGLPTGTVTFLFTDLEGSTRLWEQHPETMPAALARHDGILRDAVVAHDGHVVKTTGDGVHAAFASATHALLAARDAQLGLDAEEWDQVEPLRVRMGLHTCQADVRDGDYYGSAVNRAARLMSIAHGGQVVLSLATEELSRDSLPAELAVVDLGEHRLRDLTHAERVFQLTGPGLASEFPPLLSLDAFPTNLPRQLTSFVGRDAEVAGVANVLARVPLVTLTGVGGVGKTRLALQVAADVMPDFPDGVWLCELAGVNDAAGVVQVAATTVGVQPRRSASLEECLVEHLRRRAVLLVLDNCEHVLDPTAELARALLQQCPQVSLVATSREGLAVDGEQVWPLRSLPVPGEHESVDTVASSDAVRLFAERAAMARPGFVVDASNAGPVAEICRRLDGMPLAIELAAARVSALRPADIAARLGERFRLLSGGRRTAVERHQTLRATVDWSYSLLSDTEQVVFARLGVFSGGFDIAAAEYVASGDGLETWDVLDAVASLVDKSMLDDEETADGAVRYRMLETLRQYALERLAESGKVDTWRRRHAEHYVHAADEIGTALFGAGEGVWRLQMLAELDNFRAAATWGLDRDDAGDNALAMQIVAALALEAFHAPSTSVGSWAEQALPHLANATPGQQTTILGAAAMAAMVRGDYERAGERARAAWDVEDAAPSTRLMSFPFLALSYSQLVSGHHQAAVETLADGERVCRAAGVGDWDLSHILTSLAIFRAMGPHGDPHALTNADEAVRLARGLGNEWLISGSLHAVAWAIARDDPERARLALEEAIVLARESHHSVLGSIASQLAQVRSRTGDPAGALEALRESFRFFADMGDRPQLVAATNWGIRITDRVGELETSAVLVGVAYDGPLNSLNNFPGSRLAPDDPTLVRLEHDLGHDAYLAARARGAAMSYDQVVGYVLAELDRMLAGVPGD